jgi:hypothetical protein
MSLLNFTGLHDSHGMFTVQAIGDGETAICRIMKAQTCSSVRNAGWHEFTAPYRRGATWLAEGECPYCRSSLQTY